MAKKPEVVAGIDLDQLGQLTKAANDGDDQALAELRLTLDAHPDIWQRVGDLASHAEAALRASIAGGDKLLSESLARETNQMRVDLAGPTPCRLERMAVDRVIACWLQLQYADKLVATGIATTIAQEKHLIRWQDQTNRRYAAALRSLLLVQRVLPASGEGADRREGLRVFGGDGSVGKARTG